jgi:predicted outer membrane repeat protein
MRPSVGLSLLLALSACGDANDNPATGTATGVGTMTGVPTGTVTGVPTGSPTGATTGSATGGTATGTTLPTFTGTPNDQDGDGVPTADDCDDLDPFVLPGGIEHCDNKDSDCDPGTGEIGLMSAMGQNFTDLQLAVDAANSGNGIVYACEGTHISHAVSTDDITFIGVGGAGLVTLEGDVVGEPVIEVRQAQATLIGLTLTGGDNTLGGGLAASSATVVTIDDCVFTANLADYGGGAYVGGTGSISNSRFEANDAVFYGGGLAISDAGVFTLTDVDIVNNNADLGGGLFGFQFSFTTGINLLLDGNTANNGGGMYLWQGNFDGATVSNNTATTNGGGVYSTDGSLLTNLDIAGNSAVDGGGLRATTGIHDWTNIDIHDNISSDDGAGMYITAVTLNADATLIIRDNVATGTGGGVYANDVEWTGGVVTNNETTAGAGGGIGINPSNVTSTITDVSLDNNDAFTSGGGFYMDAGDVTLTDVSITFNYSADRAGGAYARDPYNTLTMVRGEISSNWTDGYGGGLYASQSVTTTATDVLIDSNQAPLGGGVYVNFGAQVTLNDGVVTNNGDLSTSNGGGVCIQDGDLFANNMDFGTGVDDNTPDDVYTLTSGGQYTAYAAGSTFACDQDICL